MFEIIFLGTSASAPSVERGLSANIVLHNQHRFLIDCGEGTQRQLLKSGLGFRRLNKVLLTHGHLDHILGLGGLVSTLSRWEALHHIEIYGGNSALERVKILIQDVVLGHVPLPFHVDYIPLKAGIIFEDKSFILSAFPVSHRGTGCFGFVFEEKPHYPFNADKAIMLGIPNGPERRKLVEGKTIILNDGRMISPDDVLEPAIHGTKLVFIADVGETAELVDIAQDAHALVIEATYVNRDVKMARQFGHITAAEGATLAKMANVKNLYLTHLSRRYHSHEVLAEAQAIFPNTIVVNDLDRVQVTR